MFILGIIWSCEPITPGNYSSEYVPEEVVKYTPTEGYTPSGTLPTVVASNNSDLVGTKWVLTRTSIPYTGVKRPNDTIEFRTKNKYYLNSGNAARGYTMVSDINRTTKTLTLYYFYPFGGGQYSGQLNGMFVVDRVINNAEFRNIEDPTDKEIIADFIRIK